MGRPHHALGAGPAGRARVSCPLRLPHRHHRPPHPRPRHDTVTFRYNDRAAGRQRTETVSGHEFLRRFLQHVLPAGFHKVRYYGLWHAARRDQVRNLRNALLLEQPASTPAAHAEPPGQEHDADAAMAPEPRRCPHCQTGHLRLLCRLSPARPRGP
ncbi:MAG: hypothetical protein GEV13_13350 [Rhodospirillales bacterium]|nr:hypothetical protein [Rhodospirillales bacterium]